MALVGTEVKSLRLGRASLVDAFATVDDGEVWLRGVHIPEYTQGSWTNHEPRRNRKLLLHRERDRAADRQDPRGRADAGPAEAVLHATARSRSSSRWPRGKETYDKRQDLAKRDAHREISRASGRAAKGRVREMR